MKICISSGHGTRIRGARGNPVPPQLDEVDEAIRVMNRVVHYLLELGIEVSSNTDSVSTTQSENLNRIVAWHNAQGAHDYDVSVHFNAYDGNAHGTEVLYVSDSGEVLAANLSAAIARAGRLIDRGEKYRGDLAFLNGTYETAVLIETCFCDNTSDCNLYNEHFDAICHAIAATLAGEDIAASPPATELPEPFQVTGRCSWFGGPDDTGVSPSEGLAFLYEYADAPHLFLPAQPPGTTGLARRLNPGIFYVACRWNYDQFSKSELANPSVQALVRVGEQEFLAWPADWGPNETTGRVADLSPALLAALNLSTDFIVTVIYPAP